MHVSVVVTISVISLLPLWLSLHYSLTDQASSPPTFLSPSFVFPHLFFFFFSVLMALCKTYSAQFPPALLALCSESTENPQESRREQSE